MNKERLRIFTEGMFYSTMKYCLQVLQNKVNRILLGKWRDISTEELCSQTKSLSVQQMVASCTLNTALKILRTKKPTFLHSKFKLNQRSTAFLQPMRKRVCREGFVNRAITLLNMAGDSFQQETTEKVSKKMVNEWVKENIDIKPKKTSKSSRFQQVQRRQNAVAEPDQADLPNRDRQRQIKSNLI